MKRRRDVATAWSCRSGDAGRDIACTLCLSYDDLALSTLQPRQASDVEQPLHDKFAGRNLSSFVLVLVLASVLCSLLRFGDWEVRVRARRFGLGTEGSRLQGWRLGV